MNYCILCVVAFYRFQISKFYSVVSSPRAVLSCRQQLVRAEITTRLSCDCEINANLVIIPSRNDLFTCRSKQDSVFLSSTRALPSASNSSHVSYNRERRVAYRLSSLRTLNIAKWWIILNQSSLDQLLELFTRSPNQRLYTRER